MTRPLGVTHRDLSSRARGRHPGEAVLACACGLCLVLTAPDAGAATSLSLVVIAVLRAAGVPFGSLVRAAWLPLVFTAFAVVPLGLTLDGANGWHPSVSDAGAGQALTTFARSGAALLCTLGLALTTPVADLAGWMTRLGVPRLVTDLLLGTCRFAGVLDGTLRTLRIAQLARGGFQGWTGTARSSGMVAGVLFARALDRAVALDRGIAARGGVPIDPGTFPACSVRRCARLAVITAGIALAARVLP